jgi:hypothetical protein
MTALLPELRLPEPLATDRTHSVAIRWILTRAVTLMLLVGLESDVTGDVVYYGRSLHVMFSGGTLHNTLIEYPLPVMLVLLPPFLLGGLNEIAFSILFVVAMLAVDAAFTGVLWRVDGRRRGEAVNFWLWFVPCVGPLAYFRFDVVPAALAGAAVLAALRRPALCAALTATGAALKLWPAIMLPVFLLRRGDRRVVVISFLVTGAIYAAGSLAFGGVDRTLSPLRWQSGRGLQIESVAATPLMLVRSFAPSHWEVAVSKYKAWELFGPSVPLYGWIATISSVLGLILLAVLWRRANARAVASVTTLGWLLFSTALVVTVTNKTLSPQYILWLGGPLAGLLCRDPGDRAVRRAAGLLLVISLLTQLTFPILYDDLTNDAWPAIPATLVLTVRNGLLVYLTWYSCRQVWLTSIPEPSEQDEEAELLEQVA